MTSRTHNYKQSMKLLLILCQCLPQTTTCNILEACTKKQRLSESISRLKLSREHPMLESDLKLQELNSLTGGFKRCFQECVGLLGLQREQQFF